MAGRPLDIPPINIQAKRARVVRSHGRGQPCAPQGNVVSTVRFVRPEDIHKARLARAKEFDALEARDPIKRHQYAPIGTPGAFSVYKGELVYSLCQPNQYLNARVNVDRDAEEEIFSHVGGLGVKQEIRFAGYCDFSPHETSSDDVGTIARAGTRTIVNTGPVSIQSGQKVYFSPFPYDARSPDGSRVPAVQEKGQPGDKFRPALYGLDAYDVYTALAGLRQRIDNAVHTLNEDGKPFASIVKKVHGDIDNAWLVNQAEDLPGRKYAKIYAAWSALGRVSANQRKEPETVELVLKTLIDQCYDDGDIKLKTYLVSVGEDEKTIDQHAIYDLYSNVKKRTAIFDEQHLPQLAEYIRDALERCFSKQEHYLRSKCIGTCIRGGAPGQPIDLMLGYFY